MTSQSILDRISAEKQMLRQFGVRRIGLFGSSAREEATPTSDVDLLVEFDPSKKTYRNFLHTSEYIEKILQRPVDLVTPQALSPYIKPHILKDIRYIEISN